MIKKNCLPFLFVFSLIFLFTSCKPDPIIPPREITIQPEFIVQPKSMSIAPGGVSIDLTCNAVYEDSLVEYQWYQSMDGTTASGIILDGETESTFSTPAFETKGIKYFYCVATINQADAIPTTSNICSVAYTGLPTVYIYTPNGVDITSKEEWVEGAQIRIEDSSTEEWNFDYITTDIKGRGNSTWGAPKKPYALKLSKTDSRKVLGMPKHRRWVLMADYYDKSLLRNELASKMANDVFGDSSWWNPSFKKVNLVLNGVYLGLYSLGEQIKIDQNRVNITDKTKRFIAEINARLDEAYNFKTTRGVPVSLKDYSDDYEKEPELSVFGEYAKGIIQNVEDVIYSDNYEDVKDVINVESFVNWYLINEIAKNRDAIFWSSVYCYYDPSTEKLNLGPCWDFDIGFGNDGETSCGDYEGLYIYNALWINKLMEYPEFKSTTATRFLDNYEALKALINFDENSWINNSISERLISANFNFNLYNELGQHIWPYAPGWSERIEYKDETDYLIEWTNNRLDWMYSELSNWITT